MIAIIFGILLLFFLAYANGANDNFKGVATLFGSGTTDYKRALIWATGTTALGSLAALVMAKGLLLAFSGKGLLPDSVLSLKSFSLAVGLAAALTVILATRLGFPISTTHSLIGALVGTGLFASPSGVNLHQLGSGFFLPLLISPFLAVAGTLILYPIFRRFATTLGIQKESCLCIGTEMEIQPASLSESLLSAASGLPTLSVGTSLECAERYQKTIVEIESSKTLDTMHYLSSGIVSFARGLNDTPKIAAILLAGAAYSPSAAVVGVMIAMAVGGLLSAQRVAATMALRITKMDHAQGFTANLVTALLVIFASRFSLPVSTTHVSCGSLFGIGGLSGQAKWKTISGILLAWVTTLPVAAILGAVSFFILNRISL